MSQRKKEVIGSDGHTHKISQFINCGTSYLVYGLVCPRGLLYVGRTIRPLRTRFSEHKCNIINSNSYDQSMKNKKGHNYSVPRHFKECHDGNPTGLKVFGTEAIKKDNDMGRRFQRLCRQASFWIFTLGSMAPVGMNKDLEVHGAIQKYDQHQYPFQCSIQHASLPLLCQFFKFSVFFFPSYPTHYNLFVIVEP